MAIPEPVLARRTTSSVAGSIWSTSSLCMHEIQTAVPAWFTFTPCGMSQAAMSVMVIMSGV